MDIWHIRALGRLKSGPIFFFAVPKFHPWQKDPQRVLSAGAWVGTYVSTRNRPAFFFAEHGSDSHLERSWQMWTQQRCPVNLAGFFGSATKPCGPCFMPQSTTKRLVASALSSGRHSEEPRVVVTKGNTDPTKFDRAQSTGFVGLFLVTCFGETESHLRPAQNIGRGCWAIPAVPYHGAV